MDDQRVVGRIAFVAQTDDGTALRCVVRASLDVDGWTLTLNDAPSPDSFPTIVFAVRAFAERAAAHGGVKTYSDFEIDVNSSDDPAGEAAAQSFVLEFLRCLGLRAFIDLPPRTLQ